MTSVVSLLQIPTLRELYKRGSIRPAYTQAGATADSDGQRDREARVPFSNPFLDRVSV